jgi:2-methylcitrate dehydratase PrpD
MGASGTSELTLALSRHIAGGLDRELPDEVWERAKLHLLDTLAAMVSGSRLQAGRLAAGYVERLGGRPEATIGGTALRSSAVNAAFANGMSAHADETDDSHLGGRFHPGCGIVPAALAAAELTDRSAAELLKAVTLGYDIGARTNQALGLTRPDAARHSTHSIGPAIGATAAAAALLRLDERQVRHALSYAVQQASGVPYWQRDEEHVEKAFDFGGMPARNGVAAVTMVAAGFSAVEDPFSGRHNFFTAYGEAPNPDRLVDGLGTRYEILEASIKKWSVGSPIQAALDSLSLLMAEHGLEAADIKAMTVQMPDDRLHIVDDRSMPDVCLQHLLAVMLLDGGLTFASSHDYARMSDRDLRAVRRRIRAVPNPELTRAVPARQAIVEIETSTGGRLTHRTRAVRGTPDNPMTAEEVSAKATDLISPVLGAARASHLVNAARSRRCSSPNAQLRADRARRSHGSSGR